MKIKAVIFDSSVLINLQKEKMRSALTKMISYYLPADKFINKYKRVFGKLQKGKVSEDEFFKELLKDLPSRSVKRVVEQHNNKRNKLVKLKNGVKSVLTTLGKNYKLGLVSNMPREWFLRDANRLGINIKAFNSMVFSSDGGLLKPDLSVFRKACKELKEKSDRCVYITNHEYEVDGAVKAGMTVVSVGINNGDFIIDSLNELIDLFSCEDVLPKQIHEVDMP